MVGRLSWSSLFTSAIGAAGIRCRPVFFFPFSSAHQGPDPPLQVGGSCRPCTGRPDAPPACRPPSATRPWQYCCLLLPTRRTRLLCLRISEGDDELTLRGHDSRQHGLLAVRLTVPERPCAFSPSFEMAGALILLQGIRPRADHQILRVEAGKGTVSQKLSRAYPSSHFALTLASRDCGRHTLGVGTITRLH